MKSVVVLLLTLGLNAFGQTINNNRFPDDFMFGVATSAYQVEGAWTESDKGESIWDYLVHTQPLMISGRGTGDVACDSYNHIDDDVSMLKELGVNFYRFSISWPRVLPTGYSNRVSVKGMRYYHDLIDTLVQNDITPVVTIYHWDLPHNLQKLGGWTNPTVAEYFTDYAEILFDNFGDKVKYWITFDEPATFCDGYGSSSFAPLSLKLPGIGEYLCAHTVLKAHARTYHLYNDNFKGRQQGQVGIALSATWYQPNTTNLDDMSAMERALDFSLGLFAHPIFSAQGDFPETVRQRVNQRSDSEGFPHTRLPELTTDEIVQFKGTADFFGLNHYSSVVVSGGRETPIGTPTLQADRGITTWYDPTWNSSASSWLKVVPDGFKNVLEWIGDTYDVPILVTANGFSDTGELNDTARINYHKLYLSALRDAMDAGVNVIGYTAWSLMDNFEWLDGYTVRFGLYYVNFTDADRPRTMKDSGKYYQNVILNRVADPDSASEIVDIEEVE